MQRASSLRDRFVCRLWTVVSVGFAAALAASLPPLAAAGKPGGGGGGGGGSSGPLLVIDSSGLGPTPSFDLTTRTVTLSGSATAYKAVVIHEGVGPASNACAAADFRWATEYPISTPFEFVPLADAMNKVCAIGKSGKRYPPDQEPVGSNVLIAYAYGSPPSPDHLDAPVKLAPATLDKFDYLGDTGAVIAGAFVAASAEGDDSLDPGNPGDNSGTNAGAVYVFKDPTPDGDFGDAVVAAYVKAPLPKSSDIFGWGFAFDGQTLAVAGSDIVYLYESPLGDWSDATLTGTLTSGEPDDWFGRRMALDGPRLVVGAREEDSGNADPLDNSASGAGAAYVFENVDGDWAQVAYLKAPSPQPFAYFGGSVAISGRTIVVGGSSNDPHAYVFVDADADGSFEDATLVATLDDYFAYVAISGTTIVAAKPGGGGEVGVFTEGAGGVWALQRVLAAPVPNANPYGPFGQSLGILGSYIAVGEPGSTSLIHEGDGKGYSVGAVHLFEDPNADGDFSDVVRTHFIVAKDREDLSNFSNRERIGMDTSTGSLLLAIPASAADSDGRANTGAVYIVNP